MQNYLMKSLIYFIILMALAFLYRTMQPKAEPRSGILKVATSRAYIALVPFFRFFMAIIFVIFCFIPDEKLKEITKKSKNNNGN